MKLSIIIPVYKVEAYLEKCIRSLEMQNIDLHEFELIVTNDGSPDNCRDIVIRLQAEFGNILLIDQPNQGVSMARNNAIDMATGDYVLPIDPDDYILPNTLGRVLEKAIAQNLDVLYLGFSILDEKGKKEWETAYVSKEGETFSGVDAYFESRGEGIRDPDRSWAILFKRSLLQIFDIRYPKDVPYLEDGLFVAKVFVVAERCGFDAAGFYQRTTRTGSATHSRLFYSDQALYGFIKAADEVRSFGKKNKLSIDQVGLVNHVVAKFVLLPIISCVGAKNWRAYKKIKQKIAEAGFSHLELKGCRSIYYRYASYFNWSKDWFFTYYMGQTIFDSIKYRIQMFKNNVNN